MYYLIANFVNTLPIDYKWFFSSLSQSLAALIGISGLFIVYRLQIQEDYIYDAIKALERTLEVHISAVALTSFRYSTREELLERANNEIEKLRQDMRNQEQGLLSLNKKAESSPEQKQSWEDQIATCSARITREKRNLVRLQTDKQTIADREAYKNTIQWSSFICILYMTALFFISLVGLALSDYLSKKIQVGNGYIISVLILLLGGLIMLILCCAVGLNIGREAFKKLFLR